MSLVLSQPPGSNRDTARLWIESQRLESFGFSAGAPIQIETQAESLTFGPAVLGENHVSSNAVDVRRRSIIDLANHSILSALARYSEGKTIAAYERIEVTPSRRAFAIARRMSVDK